MICINCFATINHRERCPLCDFVQAEPLRDKRALAVGTLVCKRYQIGRVLGAGGFGITYLAIDTSLNRRVALKEFVPNGLASRAQDSVRLECHSHENEAPFKRGLDKFLKEGKFLAQFDNPNVVKPFDVFLENGTAYLAMEFLEGSTLKTMLQKRGVYSEYTALDVMQFVTDALRAVHSQNIIHRDVKPDNIYQTTQGRIILLDFGGAKELTPDGDRSVDAMFAHGYAAPEQYMGNTQKVGPWTDVYACGATLFMLITSRKPPNALERMLEHQPLDWGDANVSQKTKHAVAQAMATKCEERVQSISELQILLGFEANVIPQTDAPGHAGTTEKLQPDPSINSTTEPTIEVPIEIPPTPRIDIRSEQTTTGHSGTGLSWPPKLLGIAALSTTIIGLILFKYIPRTDVVQKPRPQEIRSTMELCEKSLQDAKFPHPKMVVIPAATYRLGSGQSSSAFPSDKNTHGGSPIQLAKFEMAETETTIGQWLACVSENGCNKEITNNNGVLLTQVPEEEKSIPVTNVSFKDITGYTSWLSQKTKMNFRLPNEAEWEFASRGGTETVFPWGNDTEPDKAHCYHCRSQFKNDAPVAGKKFLKNSFELYDMQGNVFELVSDCWTTNHSSPSTSPPETCEHVQKGGAFTSPWAEMLPIYREAVNQEERKKNLGFRVACHAKSG